MALRNFEYEDEYEYECECECVDVYDYEYSDAQYETSKQFIMPVRLRDAGSLARPPFVSEAPTSVQKG
jgi:hypothetical protein